MGRPPIGDRAMTGAERVARYRAKFPKLNEWRMPPNELLLQASMLPTQMSARLANWVMPDGRKYRDWTGEEMAELGRVMIAIGEEMKHSPAEMTVGEFDAAKGASKP